jgi:ABC-type multidrug transport system ATPase subunit
MHAIEMGLGQKSAANNTGIWLQWEDLTVDVQVKADGFCKGKTTKRIVKGSRGRVSSGNILSVMGPSGAGKTSLFSSLACRGQGYEVGGKLTINGEVYDKKDLSKIAGFVFQEAVFHSHIRTEEALRLAADLKLPSTMTKKEKEQRVQMLLDAFDLRKCASTKVGDSKVKGISGGERKRLSIAIEVLTGPSLLFLDEPTSGLDAA